MSSTPIAQIQIPESLLKCKELLPSAKIVWISLLLDSHISPQPRTSKTRLATQTGLSRPTIYKALKALKANGWYPIEKVNSKILSQTVIVYTEIFFRTDLTARARLFHGLLQLASGFKGKIMGLSYSSLGNKFNMGKRTVRKVVGQLVRSGWLIKEQANQLSKISFTFRNPIKEQFKLMLSRARRNIQNASHKGEVLMKEFLSLLISSDEYEDNSRPGFLRNAKTDSLMELDRYYPKIIAFEFNGTQHYRPTDLYDAETVAKQQARDRQKSQLCADKGVRFVVIHAEDLTVVGMLSKIGTSLPLRNLRGGESLVKFLEKFGAAYRRNVPIMS